jgi:DNA-binding MarR family transcriptional regulator
VGAVPISPTPEVVSVADNVVRLTRAFNRIKAQFLSAARDDVDWSAHMLIAALAGHGPMRAGALAEAVHSDPSTVSRQVAPLVKDGFLERHADQQDGRVSVLAATAKGMRVYAAHQQVRYEQYERILADWSAEDCDRFASLLRRFTDDLERGRVNWLEAARNARPIADPEDGSDNDQEGAAL